MANCFFLLNNTDNDKKLQIFLSRFLQLSLCTGFDYLSSHSEILNINGEKFINFWKFDCCFLHTYNFFFSKIQNIWSKVSIVILIQRTYLTWVWALGVMDRALASQLGAGFKFQLSQKKLSEKMAELGPIQYFIWNAPFIWINALSLFHLSMVMYYNTYNTLTEEAW